MNRLNHMKLNEHAERAYNDKASSLLQQLNVQSMRPQSHARQAWRPDVHISATIPFKDIRDLKTSRRDREGKEASRAFHHEGKVIEIAGDGFQLLKRIAEGIHKSSDIRDCVSVSVLIDLIFDWIQATYKGETSVTMSDYVLQQVGKKIQTYDVWIPIAATRIQSEFEFGKMTFRTITRQLLDQWESEQRRAHPEAAAANDEFFERWRKALLGLAAATISLEAEPQRAYELGAAEADRTMALLRCLSPLNGFPFVVSNSVPLGQESSRGYQYFMTHNGQVAFASSGVEHTPYDEWRLDDLELAEMRSSFSMEKFSTLLKEKKPRAFQKDVIHALQLYGKSSTLREPGDKLTYILASLEALLLADRNQTIDDLVDRLVMFVDRTLEGRKDAVSTIKSIYDRRLAFVHSEHTRQDLQLLEKFMVIAWTFFINVIGNANTYKTKLEFVNGIDRLKLSRGLP